MLRRRDSSSKAPRLVFLIAAAVALLAALLLLALTLWASPEQSPEEPSGSTAAPNRRDPSAFYTANGFLRYADGAHAIGIDVSTHQGLIDWSAVRDVGVEFAILRAGYRGSTQGKLYEDEQFRYNLSSAKAQGISVGVYFFSQARDAAEAEEEAEYVCELLDGETLDLPVFFDWETVAGGTHIADPEAVPLTQCAEAFCRAVESRGYEAGVYFNQTLGYGALELAQLQDYTLWLAEYGDAPTFRYRFDCLQYTSLGSVAGIAGEVDLDLLFLEEQ